MIVDTFCVKISVKRKRKKEKDEKKNKNIINLSSC